MSENLSGQLHLTNTLGMRLSINVADEADAFDKMRVAGKHGWGPLEVPAGGFRMPLALHEKFDWSLIGAFPMEIDSEHGVMFQGQFYKRREYEQEQKGKKLPAAVKYSRGAKKTDPPHIIEQGSGDSAFVTLINFRGNGKSIAKFEVPSAGAKTQEAAPEARRQAPPLRGEARADAESRQPAKQVYAGEPITQKQADSIEKMMTQFRLHPSPVEAVVLDITNGRTKNFKHATEEEAAQIIRRLPSLRVGAAV